MRIPKLLIFNKKILTSTSPPLVSNETNCGFWPFGFMNVRSLLLPMTCTKNSAKGRRISAIESAGVALMSKIILRTIELDEELTLSFSASRYPRLSTVCEVMRCICAIRVLFNVECSRPPLICSTRNEASQPLSKQEIQISRDGINEPRRKSTR